jgi:hypothetical protein
VEINFKKAILTPFNDPNWKIKIGVGLLVILPSLVASLVFGQKNPITLLFAFLSGFIIGGYSWIVLHNEQNNIENTLPEWDFVKILIIALQGGIISFCYLLISLPILVILILLIVFLKKLAIFFIILTILLLIFWASILIPIAQNLFAQDFEFVEAFNFAKVWSIAKKAWTLYLKALLFSILIGLTYGLISGISSGVIGIFNKSVAGFIINVGQFLSIIANANLYGQTYKKAIETIES